MSENAEPALFTDGPLAGMAAPSTVKQRIAWWLRCAADRIDPSTGPRAIGKSFTIETGRGFVLHDDDLTGVRLWYMAEDYDRAFSRG